MTKKQFLCGFAILCLSLQSGSVLSAATLWDNGGPAVTTPGGSQMSDTYQGQDFVLSALSNLTDVRFWSLEASGADYTGSIFYQIVNNSGGVPGLTVYDSGLLSPTRVAAGTVLGFNQFQNDFAINAPNLAAGTYWLLLHNGPLSSTAFSDFYWSWTDLNATNTPTNRGREMGLNPSTGWTTNDTQMAFLI